MQKKQTIVVACALFFLVALSGSAFATTKGDHHKFGPQSGHWASRGHWGGGGLPALTWELHKNMTVQVLSQITKQPSATIWKELKEERLHGVFEKYKIDRKVFFKDMHMRTVELIKEFAQKGYITADQAKHIQNRMEWRIKRHELMVRLVDNGLKTGTITKEQAHMLLRGYR